MGAFDQYGPSLRVQSLRSAARRAGLEFVEKLLTTKLDSADMTGRNASMLRLAPRPVIAVGLVTSGSSLRCFDRSTARLAAACGAGRAQ